MKIRAILVFLLVSMACLTASAMEPHYKKIVVSDKFHSEGAAFGDFNKDGVIDIVSGHFWYEGPEFKKKHQIYEGKDFDPKGYSNSFVVFTDDINKDGWDDVLICPHPGTTGSWYENPKNKEGFWKAYETTIELGNESQYFVDVDGDGLRDVVFNRNDWYGFISRDKSNPCAPWKFVPVSNKDGKYQRYFHGVGAGDINGDKRLDLLEHDGWWEQPADAHQVPWKFHPFKFSPTPSYILAYDFDGDGLTDVFTTLHCHKYGVAWYRQVKDAKGNIDFVKNSIMPEEPGDDYFPLVSQMHAMVLADMNGDGVMDVVTGKRWWAHGPKTDARPNDPAILMWWETKRLGQGKVDFIPHILDYDCGVGTQVTVQDINKDGVPDILVGNKKGTRILISCPAFPNKSLYGDTTQEEWDAYQKLIAPLSPEEKAWEEQLQANLGGFFYFQRYIRSRLQGKPGLWAFVHDNQKLPRVLLIGDSISNGYTTEVQKLLNGKANVHRAPANCGSTDSCLRLLPGWLGARKWDVIHFNFGIHDRAKTPEAYKANLEKVVAELKKTGAKLVFATTTPFKDKDGKLTDTAAKFNAVAKEVMKAQGIPVDDLFSVIEPDFDKLVNKDGVHYQPEGSKRLGKQVASVLQEELTRKK